MYPAKSGLLIGFHGCDQSICDKVVAGQVMLKASENEYDWLGHGMYFWESNYERALEFAIHSGARKKIPEPAVLGAVIDLQNCLDLLDTKYLRLVKHAFTEMVSYSTEFGRHLPTNRRVNDSNDFLLRELDCAVIEHMHDTRQQNNLPPFDSVRGMFAEGNELYPGAGFKDKNHIQICIRNPNCIKAFFHPRKELKWAG